MEYMYGPTTARPTSFFDPPSLGTVYTDNMKLTRSRHVGRMVKTNASLYTGNAVFLLITVFRFFKVFPPIIMDTLTYGSERMHLFTSSFYLFIYLFLWGGGRCYKYCIKHERPCLPTFPNTEKGRTLTNVERGFWNCGQTLS